MGGRFVSILLPVTLRQICAQPDCQLPLSGEERRGSWFLDTWSLAWSSPAQQPQTPLEGPSGPALPPAAGDVAEQAVGALRLEGVVFPGSQTEIEGGSCGDSGGGKGQPGPRCAQPARQAQPVFGEVAESEFQEAITLVETSFLWPGLVTWLGGDQRQAGPQVWAGSHRGSCCHRLLSPEA